MPHVKPVRMTRTNAPKSQMRRTRSRRRRRSETPRAHPLLTLQQTIGNQAVGRMLQAKLTVGRSGDPFERDADRVAEQVVHTPDSVHAPAAPLAAGTLAPTVQRMPETENDLRVLQGPHEAFEGPLEEDEPVIRRMPQLEGEEKPTSHMAPMAEEEDETLRTMPVEGEAEDEAVPSLQTKPNAHVTPVVSPMVASHINNMRGSGRPLAPSVRAYFEPRFGADLGQVRVHTDTPAASTAKAIQARAFTVGRDIAFGAGEYAPTTMSGRKLVAHELAHVVQQNRRVTPSLVMAKTKRSGKTHPFPWIGEIANTWSAALRETPKKDAADPHGNTLADLPRGTQVTVVNRRGGWLQVSVNLDGKALDGYVSQELINYVKPSAFELPEITITVRFPSVAEAFVELKKAEKKRAKEGSAFKPSEDEESRISMAIAALRRTKKYEVDDATLVVTFAREKGTKTEITTIEDFILFVEQVEKQYPTASPQEVASEIRQLWFSDVNWELLVASEGISQAGKAVDIETEPDPIASQFNMKTLAPAQGSLQLNTRMGKVDIGHVMAGIDARLSGFPSTYPKARLEKKGYHSDDTELKYKTLKAASGGDSRDFTTWAGDLGQAYAEYLVDRYVKGNASASFSTFISAKAPAEELLGDIHGYIAVEVYRKVPASVSPTGTEHKVSNVLRDMYLVEKPAHGETYQKYVEEVSGKSGVALKAFITERALAFARPWYAKKAYEHRGWWESEGWTAEGVLEEAMKDFDKKHQRNEKSADPKDKLETLVERLFQQMSGLVK